LACRLWEEVAVSKMEIVTRSRGKEYKPFNPTQHIDSDFDKEVKGLLKKK